MTKSGVVGLAHPPEFSEPVARGLEVKRRTLAQPISASHPHHQHLGHLHIEVAPFRRSRSSPGFSLHATLQPPNVSSITEVITEVVATGHRA
jgi:hypothetical protein